MTTEKNIELARQLLKRSRQLVSNLESYQKYHKTRHEIYETATQTRLGRLRDNIASTGENIMRIENEIHCICVELGLAKREDWRYGDFQTGAPLGTLGNKQHIHFREPKYEPGNGEGPNGKI